MITEALSPHEQEIANAAAQAAVRAMQTAAPAPMTAPAPAGFGAQVVSGPWGSLPGTVAPGFAPATAALPNPTGVALKMTLQLPDGSAIPFDINFGPEMANPQILQSVVSAMLQQGWPVKVYKPRDNGFGGGNGFRGGRSWGGGGYGGRRW